MVEADIVESTGLGRTPVREALLRMVSIGLIAQQPRRGLLVSHIDLAEHLDVIQTRRVLERLIAACAARRASCRSTHVQSVCCFSALKIASAGWLASWLICPRLTPVSASIAL